MFDLTIINFEKVINDLWHDVDKNLKVIKCKYSTRILSSFDPTISLVCSEVLVPIYLGVPSLFSIPITTICHHTKAKYTVIILIYKLVSSKYF